MMTPFSPEQSPSRPVNLEEHPPESDSAQIKSGRTEDESQIVTEKSLTSTPVKAPHTLAPPQLALLRTEKTDSFDMEEVRCSDVFRLSSQICFSFRDQAFFFKLNFYLI